MKAEDAGKKDEYPQMEETGWVKDFTYARLIKHNFNRTHPEYEHAQIPTLEEVYALIKPTDLTINVEIKTGVVFYPEIEERVLDLTERMGLMSDRILSTAAVFQENVIITFLKNGWKIPDTRPMETASLVCMPASKHEIFNADYQTRCKYYQEIFDFILQNRREKHETEIK